MKKVNEHEIEKLISELSLKGAPSEDGYEAEKETDAQSQTVPEGAEGKDAEFEKLIKGDYKEQFEKRIRDNLKRRFKESSASRAKAAENEKIIGALMSKYGIDKFDASELIDAINSDNSHMPGKMTQKNADDDIARRIRELELENEHMKKQRAQKAMQDTINSWITDEKELKKSYPDFSIEDEAENAEFVKMLKAGVSLKNAYLAVHHEEIVKDLVEKAAMEAKEKTALSIKTRGQRPLENGMTSKSTALYKTDVSKLSPAERAEIAKRVAKGEIISF